MAKGERKWSFRVLERELILIMKGGENISVDGDSWKIQVLAVTPGILRKQKSYVGVACENK